MKPADKIKELIKKSDVRIDTETDRRILSDAMRHLEKLKQRKSAERQPNIWRSIMRSRMTKLAAAAVIVIAVVLSINVCDRSINAAYALEQTIEANHTIKTIHLREFLCEDGDETGEFVDCWIKYNDAGLVSNVRQNFHGDVGEDDDNLRFTVWNEGVCKTWYPLKRRSVVIVIRESNAEEYWQDFANKYDPKLILQRLYDEQEDGVTELRIEGPSQSNDSIYVEAINSVDKTRLKLIVDSETKLVKQFSIYGLCGREDELDFRVEFLVYNQPIDPSVFELSGIPDDALVVNRIGQFAGLERGGLTDEEIAVKVVRECLEATIAQNYNQVIRLMEGAPGDSFEKFVEEEFGAKLSRVISIGQPEPHDIWSIILCVPCEIEVENEERGKWVVNIIATAKPIDAGDRWIVHPEIYNHLGLLGIEQGDLTKDEIAVRVVRECLEATIAQDYNEVSRLMEGAPGDSFEKFIEEEFGARLVRVVSIGQPEPHERWKIILCVPCEIEVENEEGGKWIVNIIATAKPIGYQPIHRWIVDAEIEVNE